MAPETLSSYLQSDQKNVLYSYKSDMWAIGLVIHEIITGYQIFNGSNSRQVANDIQRFGSYFRSWESSYKIDTDKMPQKISPEQRKFIKYYLPWQKVNYPKIALLIDKLLKNDPNERLDAQKALFECKQIMNDQELKNKSQIQIDNEINSLYQQIAKLKQLDVQQNQQNNMDIENHDINQSMPSQLLISIGKSQENNDMLQKQLNYYKKMYEIQREVIKVIEQEKEQLILQVNRLFQIINNAKNQIFIGDNQQQNIQLQSLQQDPQSLNLQQDGQNQHQNLNNFQTIQNLEVFQEKPNDNIKYILEKNQSQFCDTYLLPNVQNITQSYDKTVPLKIYKKPIGDNPKKQQQFTESFNKFVKLQQYQQYTIHLNINLIPIKEIYVDNLEKFDIFNYDQSTLQNMNYFAIAFKQEDINLEDYIRQLKNKGLNHYDKQTIKNKIYIIYLIALQIQYLHQQGLCHGQLNIKNIAYNAHETKFKVGFYSLQEAANSKMSKNDMSYFEQSYMSPQQLKGEISCFKDDIWTIGVIFHYVLTFSPLFQFNQFMKDIIIKYDSSYFKIWDTCNKYRNDQNKAKYTQSIVKASTLLDKVPTKQIAEFINRLLSNDPNNRPYIQEVVQQIKQFHDEFS